MFFPNQYNSFQNKDVIFINAKNHDEDIEGVNLLNQQFGNPRFVFPKNFTIVTQGSSCKFNIDMIKDLSPTIDRFLKSQLNFVKDHYYLEIKDETNVLFKFEQLCDGNEVTFSTGDIFKLNEFIQALELKCFPDFIQNIILKANSSDLYKFKFVMRKQYYLSFLKKISKNFTIKTKKSEYICNTIGIKSSKIISKFIEDNPSLNVYMYDFKDENNEFQTVCDYFNYSSIKLTPTNYQIIKKISNELQVEFLLNEIDNFTNNYIYFTRVINEHRLSINSVEQLVKYLYNREGLNVESIKDFILHSIWSSDEKHVLELSAYIYQVLQQSYKSHPFLIELIALLDQNETENNEIKKLKPFLIKALFKNLYNSNFICSFVYKLYEKEMISLKELTSAIIKIYNKKQSSIGFSISKLFLWFFPELIETNLFTINYIISFLSEKHKKIVELYYPSKIDEFKEMRKRGHPDDEFTKALINDDVDKLQTILSDKSIDIKIPFNIYDSFFEDSETGLINYCAFHGLKKCFEYLLSKNIRINKLTISYSLHEDNDDIFKIILNKIQNYKIQLDIIKELIIKHRNSYIKKHYHYIYQWENKDFISLIQYIFTNGNIHSFIKFIEEGLDLYSLPFSQIRYMISSSASSGFYTLTNLLIDLLFKNENNSISKSFASDPFRIINIRGSSFFGNLSILKLYEPYITKKIYFQDSLIIAVHNEYYDILKYSFDSPFRQKIYFSSFFALNLIKESFKNTNLSMFNYLKEKFVNEEKLIKNFHDPNNESLLTSACSSGNLEIVTTIFESMYQKNPKIDCLNSFLTAASKGYDKICKFLINKNANISFDNIRLSFFDNKLPGIKMISLLYNFLSNEKKEMFILKFLNLYIKQKNYEVVDFLLEKNGYHNDSLFEAVKISDEKMVSLILKYDSSPSFINRISEDGTALNIAVKSNYYNITKLLLSIKGINPSLYGKDYLTPLVSAFQNFNIDIINLFFEFYGEDIQTQTYQLNKSFRIILRALIDRNESENNDSNKQENKSKFGFPSSINKLTNSEISDTKSSSIQKSTDNEISVIKKLLEDKNIDINYQYNNYSLLSYSCKNNLIDIVSILIELNDCNLNQYSPIDGNSPLIIAIKYKNIEIINLLLKSPKIKINQPNYQRETALTLAVSNELSDIVDLIINDPRFDANESRLSYSFSIANNLISQKLKSHKDFDANLFYAYLDYRLYNTWTNKSLLIKAVEEMNTEKIKMILKHSTFDPDKSQVIKAIFLAAQKNNIEMFRILLPFINNDVNIHFSDDSLLTVSSRNDSEEIVHEIINNPNFDPLKSMMNEAFASIFKNKLNENICNMLLKADKNHLIDFQKLLKDGKSYFTKSTCMSVSCIKYLLNHGANPDNPDAFGIYPLQHAISNSSFDSAITLIDSKQIDLNRKLNNQSYIFNISTDQTYLHLAANNSNTQILKKILELNVIDVNEIDEKGETPLMYAVRKNNIENIKLLFERKDLDFLKRNNDGDDALSIAKNNISSESWQDTPKSKEDYLQILLFYVSKKSSFRYF